MTNCTFHPEDKTEVHITGMDKEDAYRYLDATQNNRLRELVDEWKEAADNPEIVQAARQRAWEDAKQLEDIIND